MAQHVGERPSPSGYQSEGKRQVAIDSAADSVVDRRGAEIGVSGQQWLLVRGALLSAGRDRDPRKSDVDAIFGAAPSVLGAKPRRATASRPAHRPPLHEPARRAVPYTFSAAEHADSLAGITAAEVQGKHLGRLEFAARMGGVVGKAVGLGERARYAMVNRRHKKRQLDEFQQGIVNSTRKAHANKFWSGPYSGM